MNRIALCGANAPSEWKSLNRDISVIAHWACHDGRGRTVIAR
jgi:hypothetical protein